MLDSMIYILQNVPYQKVNKLKYTKYTQITNKYSTIKNEDVMHIFVLNNDLVTIHSYNEA